ncbi:hypothetical protein CE91St62_12440 [Lachnospiraceae bacterium]|uniref:phasin family protein n=1 Tax=Extibacter sp. GGCC_0201 TaxID=2731209 RepID=UPI001AA19A19|nr:phasin family protein [Extibacter sp. GGCC_0201]MBO1720066.1 hypothetical protein [Extibacter sp. GGCC_0201]BDF33179.1 hypothetical protein CE91St61_12540 [Lachnospiraceae bacterium]BDF37183.1 hypothetical protein CE91St62_12440 [Lachnospiraceae bacterium]
MDNLGESLKKVMLAGVGALATTAEKSKEILDDLVKKGELTVEQGKVLNEELKHNVKKAVKENVTVKVKPSSPEELEELLDKMTPEQIDQLKEKLAGLGQTPAEEPKDAGKPQDALEDEKDSGAADE